MASRGDKDGRPPIGDGGKDSNDIGRIGSNDEGDDSATSASDVVRNPVLRLSVSTMEGYDMSRLAMEGLTWDNRLGGARLVEEGGDDGSAATSPSTTPTTTPITTPTATKGKKGMPMPTTTTTTTTTAATATTRKNDEGKKERDTIEALAEDSDEEDVVKRSGDKRGTPLDGPTVNNMNDLAGEHLKRGNYDKAIFLLEEILKAKKAEFGETHRDVGAATHNLAVAHVKAQKYDRALPLCQEAVRIRKLSLGEEDLETAASLVKLGTVLCFAGKREAALDAHREALRIRRIRLGEKDQSVAQVLNHVGTIFFEEGESLSALSAFDDALRIQRLSPTSNNERGETLSNIGTVRMKRQQYKEAITAFEEAYSVQQLEYKDGHPVLIYTLDCLAFSHAKDGNNRESVKAYKKMLRTQIATYGPKHIDCALTLNKIGAIYEKSENYDAAYECARQALSVQKRRLPENHPQVIQSKKAMARIERRLRRLESQKNCWDTRTEC